MEVQSQAVEDTGDGGEESSEGLVKAVDGASDNAENTLESSARGMGQDRYAMG
jgi:hypothetical protein